MIKAALPLFFILPNLLSSYEGLSPQVWKKKGFENPIIRDLSQELYKEKAQNYTHRVPLTLVHFQEYFWKKKDLIDAAQKVVNAYGDSCGLKFFPLSLVSVKKGGRLHLNAEDSYDRQDPHGEFTLLKRLPKLPKPIGFFVENHSENCDWDNGEECYSWLPGEARFSLYNEGLINNNTFWISEGIYESNTPDRDLSKTLAHELAHVLLNEKDMHFEENGDSKNLMKNIPKFMSTQASPDQCQKIYDNPLVEEI